jgi:hypothetical protein
MEDEFAESTLKSDSPSGRVGHRRVIWHSANCVFDSTSTMRLLLQLPHQCPGSRAHLRYHLVQAVISMCMRPRRRATELRPKPSLSTRSVTLVLLGPAISFGMPMPTRTDSIELSLDNVHL